MLRCNSLKNRTIVVFFSDKLLHQDNLPVAQRGLDRSFFIGPYRGPEVFTMCQKEISIICSIANCTDFGEFVPGFDTLNKKYGRPILPEELAKHALCKIHKRLVENAARHRGKKIEIYPFMSALNACERFHAQRAEEEAERVARDEAFIAKKKRQEEEEVRRAKEAKELFEKQLQEYLGRLLPNAMADFEGKELSSAVKCSFGTCGHEAAHEAIYVPSLDDMNLALGRDTRLEDLLAFTLCFDHRKALGNRGSNVQFHKLAASVKVIERNHEAREKAREEAAAANDFLADLFDEDMSDSNNNSAEVVECIGIGCLNTIPVSRNTLFCPACRHDCEGGCGRKIPKRYKYCKECSDIEEPRMVFGTQDMKGRPDDYKRKKREKANKDRTLRMQMKGSGGGGGGKKGLASNKKKSKKRARKAAQRK